MQTVVHHDRETTYEVADRDAAGPSLCLVHGSGASRAVWKSQHRLSDQYPIVALDLSGHGDADDIDADPGYATLSAYGDDVLAVLEETNAGVLLGNSLGGAVVMHLLLERNAALEERLDAVILTGTGAKLGVLEDLRWWLEHDFERALEFLHEPGRLFADPDPRVREISIQAMKGCGQEVTQRDFLTCHEFDVRGQLQKISLPALVLCGEDDQLTPPHFHEYLADSLSNGRLVTIPDSAHMAMLEQPAAFNKEVASFLDEVLEDSSDD